MLFYEWRENYLELTSSIITSPSIGNIKGGGFLNIVSKMYLGKEISGII